MLPVSPSTEDAVSPPPAWNEFTRYKFGFVLLEAENASCLSWEWVQSGDGAVLDRVTLTQELPLRGWDLDMEGGGSWGWLLWWGGSGSPTALIAATGVLLLLGLLCVYSAGCGAPETSGSGAKMVRKCGEQHYRPLSGRAGRARKQAEEMEMYVRLFPKAADNDLVHASSNV